MNSNFKLLPATLLVAVLALAGCGGGGSDDMTPDPMPMPTPEEECLAGGGVVYEDGVCKTAEDLRNEGRDAEAEEREAAEAEAARQAAAEKFHGLLEATTPAAVAQPANGRPAATPDYSTQITAAEDGAYNQGMIRIMFSNTMGSATQAEFHTGTSRDADNTALTENPRHVMGSGFATGQNELKTHEADDEVSGSYMGAAGTYTCSADDCTSRRTANGIQLGGTGTWSFVPNANSMYSIPDGNYAEYGWWLDETVAGVTGASRVGAWYANQAGAAIADLVVTGSSGTASYTGQAIGVAAYHHSFGGDANAGGAFTADAALSANFDTNMLSGSITNFDVDGHNPDWSVALGASAIATDTSEVANAGTTTWTIGGTAGTARNEAAGGGWSAKFYDIPTGAHQPTGVAGGFKARYDSDGYMVDAFGAEQ